MGKCVMSASSKEDLTEMVNQYFYSKNYIITDDWGICVEAAEADDVAYNSGELTNCKDKSVAASADAIAMAIKNAVND